MRATEGFIGGPHGLGGIPNPFSFVPAAGARGLLYAGPVLILATLAYLRVQRITHSPFARLMKAVRDDELAARALAGQPRVLLLDEPTAALSVKVADELFRIITDLASEGISVVLVEQNTAGALAVSHRAYVLVHGEVLAAGPSGEIASNEEVVNRVFGRSPVPEAGRSSDQTPRGGLSMRLRALTVLIFATLVLAMAAPALAQTTTYP